MVCVCLHCSALVSAFEKAKKKYVVKLKKMETQMQLMTERHESQVGFAFVIIVYARQYFERSASYHIIWYV